MLGSDSLFLNSLFFWDYGFRESPAFTYTFAQRNLSRFEEADDGSLDLSLSQVDHTAVLGAR